MAAAVFLAIALGSLVMAGAGGEPPEPKWPGEIRATPESPTALDRLREIHTAAIEAMETATPAERPDLVRVLKAAFTCAAFDGTVPVGDPPPDPLPPHAPGHVGAAAKVEAAWQAMHSPPAPPEHPEEWKDWKKCADELEHGH